MKINDELIGRLEYIVICAERAIQQEKGKMEKLGRWYINQELDDIERAVKNARVIYNGNQFSIEFDKND